MTSKSQVGASEPILMNYLKLKTSNNYSHWVFIFPWGFGELVLGLNDIGILCVHDCGYFGVLCVLGPL
jgi:hypothetical protein